MMTIPTTKSSYLGPLAIFNFKQPSTEAGVLKTLSLAGLAWLSGLRYS
jgi:hypothetical protein